MSTAKKWHLVSETKVKWADEERPKEAPAECHHCGAGLWAAFYVVSDGKNEMIVGSSCVKKLTGVSLAQLKKEKRAAEKAAREIAAREIAERDITVTKRRYFEEANPGVCQFVEERRFKSEFFESCWNTIQKYGSLTEKQMAVIKRLMDRNRDAELPKVKDYVEVEGTIERIVKALDGYATNRWAKFYLLEIDIKRKDRAVFRVTIRETTSQWKRAQQLVHGQKVKVGGTVKYAKDGLVILTRATILEG